MNILRKNRKSNFKYNKMILKRVIIFIFSLIVTTLAWITYSKILNDQLKMHIVSWDLSYSVDYNESGTYIPISVENDVLELNVTTLYPEMDDQIIDVKITNNGEASIDLSYILNNLSILGHSYEMVGALGDAETDYYIILNDPEINENTLVSTQNILNNVEDVEEEENENEDEEEIPQFPFNMVITLDTQLEAEENNNEAHLIITISWEGTNDEQDTEWGYNVARYINGTYEEEQQEENVDENEDENVEEGDDQEIGSPLKLILQIRAVQVIRENQDENVNVDLNEEP